MDRLVDYFAVFGYNIEDNNKDSPYKGKIITRIPENDHKDCKMIEGVHLFCQPAGWFLTKKKKPPTFYVVCLTDEVSNQHYCAIHTFYESIKNSDINGLRNRSSDDLVQDDYGVKASKSNNVSYAKDEEDVDESLFRVAVSESDDAQKFVCNSENKEMEDEEFLYAPKCLVIQSRKKHFKVFKNCLGLIYTMYMQGMSLELVIAKLLLVRAPSSGSLVKEFSIGALDKQAIFTPRCQHLPVTSSSVTMLLRQLGILNVMNVLCAALVDQKVILFSCSYSRLTDACNALTALMYPFTYSNPFIPIVPKQLLEVTSSPTPFMFGIHSSFKQDLTQDLLDVICVDLDGGVISVPECVTLPQIPEPFYTSTVETLTKVLCPDLMVADYAYPPDDVRPSEPEKLDKEIRAIFLRLFCQLLMGYRSCLQLCRVNPYPILRFEKESYLTMRGFDVNDTPQANEFLPKLLDSQAFQLFVQKNGPPYRQLHMFDRVVSEIPDRIQQDINNVYEALSHIKQLSNTLYYNENATEKEGKMDQVVPKPPEQVQRKNESESKCEATEELKFPLISATAVQTFMQEHKEPLANEQPESSKPEEAGERVPEGVRLSSYGVRNMGSMLSTSSRRLEVMKNCLSFIFDSKTLEIKKIFQAVLRALKSRTARSALTHELASYAKQRPKLDNQQFDFIARLINCSLQDSSGQLDENTVAADLLPIVTAFYRNLCPTVMQFMYSVVQDHIVWRSLLFWEKAFFVDVQDEIKNLYSFDDPIPSKGNEGNECGKRDNQLCMEIAARELKKAWESSNEEEKRVKSQMEESIIFSQAQHCAHRMVFMLVPLDPIKRTRNIKFHNANLQNDEGTSTNSFFSNSLNGSINGSLDEESGFGDAQETTQGEFQVHITKQICKFVDKVCTESSIKSEHTKTLVSKIPGLVHMQIDSLKDVYKESKRLPPIQKAKLMSPQLLIGEHLDILKPVRSYLLPDGRGTATGGNMGGLSLLPAEGAIYLTNYRVIFIGIPCDILAAEQVVIRSFPISSLFKTKSFNAGDICAVHQLDSNLQYGFQMRSCTFQLMMLAMDCDVTGEEVQRLHAELHKRRYPLTIEGSFAVSASTNKKRSRSDSLTSTASSVRSNSRFSNTLAGATMASGVGGAKTLLKQAKRKVGIDKNRSGRTRLIDSSRTSFIGASASAGHAGTLGRMPMIDEHVTKTLKDNSTMSYLSNMMGEEDYKRLGLLSSSSNFVLTKINRMFSICRSYPVCAVLPRHLSNEQVKSLSHCHNLYRFPCIVWTHPINKTLLIRSSAIRSRTSSSLFKRGHSIRSDDGTPGSSSELERYLLLVASFASPMKRKGSGLFSRMDSIKSKTSDKRKSFIMTTHNSDDVHHKKQTLYGKTSGLARNFATSVRKGRKPTISMRHLNKNDSKMESKDLRSPSIHSSTESMFKLKSEDNKSSSQSSMIPLEQILTRDAHLYVFGEKSQLKGMRQEQQGRVLFVPIDFIEPKQIRTSFKSLLKAILPAEALQNHNNKQSLTTTISATRINSNANLQQNVNGNSKQNRSITENYLRTVDESSWLEQVSSMMQIAGAAVDVMDIQGASVMISVDDGMDITPQISSLTQLLMDPYYRTVDGFKTLVQKEWLSFGHRFSHRNRFNDVHSSGFTPVFLQFLDAVFQVHVQFPMAFEFNATFIETIAYHSISNRFTTFLLDSDYERLEAGILFDSNNINKSKVSIEVTTCNDSLVIPAIKKKSSKDEERCKSLWDYITQVHNKSPIFLNSLYLPGYVDIHKVLRPVSAASKLVVWPYYVREALGDGPPYDSLSGELNAGSTSHNEQEATETSEVWGGSTARRIVNRCYDNVDDAQPSSIKMLLQQIDRLHVELGIHSNAKWIRTWQEFNQKTLEKASVIAEQMAAESRYSIHESSVCSSLSPSCNVSVCDEDFASHQEPDYNQTNQLQFTNNQTEEVRSYEGLLYKQGQVMKSWKLRFFVLDLIKHQLRQYENSHDTNCKTIIDLKDLESVKLGEPISGAPKSSTSKSFITMNLTKRSYHFVAENDETARLWVENLQSAL